MKNKVKMVYIGFSLILIIGLGSGCAGNQNQFSNNNDDAEIVRVHTSKSINQSVANEAKEKVIKEK